MHIIKKTDEVIVAEESGVSFGLEIILVAAFAAMLVVSGMLLIAGVSTIPAGFVFDFVFLTLLNFIQVAADFFIILHLPVMLLGVILVAAGALLLAYIPTKTSIVMDKTRNRIYITRKSPVMVKGVRERKLDELTAVEMKLVAVRYYNSKTEQEEIAREYFVLNFMFGNVDDERAYGLNDLFSFTVSEAGSPEAEMELIGKEFAAFARVPFGGI